MATKRDGSSKTVKVRKKAVKTSEELGEVLSVENISENTDLKLEGSKLPATAQASPTNLVDIKYFKGSYTPIVSEYLRNTDIKLTKEEESLITSEIQHKARGLTTSVPLSCSGDKCPFKEQCPFFKIGKAPEGFACPVESMLLDLYTKRYLDEFGVLVDSFSETTTMTMLAATHVMEMRAWKVLGEEENSTGIIENVVGFNEDEEPITQLQEHPAFQILERAWRWRDKLLTSLVGTRREKYKRESALKEKPVESSFAMKAADLKSKIDKLAVMRTGE